MADGNVHGENDKDKDVPHHIMGEWIYSEPLWPPPPSTLIRLFFQQDHCNDHGWTVWFNMAFSDTLHKRVMDTLVPLSIIAIKVVTTRFQFRCLV